MNKPFLISSVAMFGMLVALGFLVHGLLLAPDYAHLPNLFRSADDQMGYFPFMLAGQLCLAFASVWIYRRIREPKPFLAQGVRYGLVMAAVAIIPRFLIYYAVQPTPVDLVVKQIVFDSLGMVLMGIVVAFLNPPVG